MPQTSISYLILSKVHDVFCDLKKVRKYAQSYCRPGMSMIDICQRLEAKTKELILASGLQCGYGFPTGCSINHVAAHYTPNYGDTTILNVC
jgi:methionyl aminopeptidase